MQLRQLHRRPPDELATRERASSRKITLVVRPSSLLVITYLYLNNLNSQCGVHKIREFKVYGGKKDILRQFRIN